MANIGEEWVKKVMEEQGFFIEVKGEMDIYGFKDILGIVIEEKDWKDPVKVFKNKIYQRGINGRWYYKKRSQITKYGYGIRKENETKKIYRYIICSFVVSNLQGRQVQPIYFRKFGTIFVVSKAYFPVWLKSIEKTYLGELSFFTPNMYMGGK